MSHILNNFFIVTGSGILIIEKIDNQFNFILVFNQNKNTFDIPGGRVDENVSENETSIKELFEETQGLFKIKKKSLFYNSNVFYTKMKNYYRLYKIYIFLVDSYIDIDNFYKNKVIIQNSNLGKSFNETNKIIKLKLEDFINDNYNFSIRFRDKEILNIIVKLNIINLSGLHKLKLYNTKFKKISKAFNYKLKEHINTYIIQ